MKQGMRLLIAALLLSQAHAQSSGVKGSLDPMFDWSNPWSLTPTKFKEIAESLPKKSSERAYSTYLATDGKVSYGIGPGHRGGSSGGGKTSLFNGDIKVDSLGVSFEGDKAISFYLGFGKNSGPDARKVSAKELAKLKAGLARVTGDNAPKPYDQNVGGGHPPVVGQQWNHRNYTVQMFEVHIYNPSGRSSGLGVFSLHVTPLVAR